MTTVHKSVLIWYSADEMFGLVTDVNAYPQFLPWCDHSAMMFNEDGTVSAQIGISFGGIRQTFRTHNTHTSGRQVEMKLIDGPFSNLEGGWTFAPLGDGSQRACRVELNLKYGFSNATLGKLVGPVFDKIASSMVEAFVKRAEQVYG